jgi:hypothetical protein
VEYGRAPAFGTPGCRHVPARTRIPVCGAEVLGLPAAPCPSYGLPAAGQAGTAAGVAPVPSALAVAASPSALRLVLVVAGAVVLVVVGTLLHRQAPFVLCACALAFVVVTRLGPCAPLLPTWVTLAADCLLLLVLGAIYERLQQPP